jgi:TRAP-type C4-dicarboxylate transport system permease small subunit
MAATVWFVVMAIFACILLFVTSLLASIGAGDAYASSLYNTDSSVRSAHQNLVIASVLGWVTLVILVIIIIVAAVSGLFTWPSVSEALKSKDSLTQNELAALYKGEKELSSGQTSQVIVLIVMIILGIIIFIIGILSAIAAVSLSSVTDPDAKAKNAYNMSIWASIFGVGVIGSIIIAIIAYIAIRANRNKSDVELRDAIKKGEKSLNITDDQLAQIVAALQSQGWSPPQTVTTTTLPNVTVTPIK